MKRRTPIVRQKDCDIMNDMKNLKSIKKVLSSEQPYLAKKYGVKKIGIFGSFVFGDNQEESDIDVLVEINEPIGLFDLIELEDYLSKKLGRKVDLVLKSSLKEYIKSEILNSTVYV